ncbi:MAG: hypothetical protein LBQ88_11560 [Treponema sp.]|jgi:hypothetical protein|nr:hypothetical protein [Treponema sp.]
MKIWKPLIFTLVLFLVLGQVTIFAAGNRKAVDDYLKSYEAYVVEAETLAKKNTISAMDMMPLQQKALDFTQKAQTVQSDAAWTAPDSAKLLQLTERYNKAMTTITNKIS